MKNNLITCGAVFLMIYGNNLNFDNITSVLELQPTRTIRKGDILRKNMAAEQDLWEYEKKYNDLESLNTVLTDFAEEIKKVKDISGGYEKSVRIYMNSEPAQIFFSLPQDILKKISDLELDIDISILSWGFVEDEEDGKRDIRQVNDAAKEAGLNEEERIVFSKYIEDLKRWDG